MQTTIQTTIVTLQMDAASQAFFERMRQVHYPAERNQIAAHLTLFHQLPATADVANALLNLAAGNSAFAMQAHGLRSLGRGVAYSIRSLELMALHGELAGAFRDDLTPQDRQKFAPHVVVQNKALGEQARALLAQLEREFRPFEVGALGFELWNYLGGPWELIERFPFAG